MNQEFLQMACDGKVDSCYFPVLAAIERLSELERPVIAAIDGRCGSGKSSLAERIREVYECNVFHMDDFYLPKDQRSPQWEHIPAGNIDLKRFEEEILCSVRDGKGVMYRPYDCQKRRLDTPTYIPHKRLTIVEGSYSHHPKLEQFYDLKIFLSCSPEIQQERLTRREGEGIRSFLTHWIPLEEQYFKAFEIEKNSAMVIDTGSV